MQKTDVIKELKELYSIIPAEKKKLFEDFLQNINLKNISRHSLPQNNSEDIFKDSSLTNTLYHWDNLNDYIISYLQTNPLKNILIMQWILSYNPN